MDLFEYQGKQFFAAFDIPVSPGKMRIELPVAKGVTGWVRGEFTPDRPVHRLPLRR